MNRSLAIALGLVGSVLAIYAQVSGHDFVAFDDPLYRSSLLRAPEGSVLGWAFTNDDAFLFHPLTWLSYRLDLALFGAEAAGAWLLVNVALHATTAVLLAAALRALGTGPWVAASAAALFALHPVQAEAVAWVSARKEVLAGCCFAATLLAYAAYARRGGALRFLAWNGLAVLGLLAKGTLAPLPFLLLLLDLWPLGRLRIGPFAHRGPAAPAPLGRLVAEKLPLLAASLAVVAVGFGYAAAAWNVWLEDPPLAQRIAAAPQVALQGLVRLLWPTSLAISYPSPAQMGLEPWPGGRLALSALVLLATSGAVLVAGVARPWLLVGWLWFLGMLTPVLGIVPMGLRTLHDRYLYLPMIGIALGIARGGADLLATRGPALRRAAVAGAAGALLLLGVLAARQAALWQDGPRLLAHAVRVNPRNAVAQYSLAIALAGQGREAEAMEHLERALAIHPRYPDANTAYGFLLQRSGQLQRALAPLRRAVAARPDWALARRNLGNALVAAGETEEGLEQLEEATRLAPASADAHYALAAALASAGRTGEAKSSLRAALSHDPEHRFARALLARLEARGGSGSPGPPGAD